MGKREFTAEHKRKIKESKMGHEVSQETREKISNKLKNNTNHKGFSQSDDTKKKISESIKRTLEQKKNLNNC
jgi:hypothetical protein